MNIRGSIRVLNKLAHLWGVQTVYYDVSHQRRRASVETILSVLTALGAPVSSFRDVVPAWRERQSELWQRLLEPVVVAWEGKPPLMTMRLPSNYADLSIDYCLLLENGESDYGRCSLADLPVLAKTELEGQLYVAKQFTLQNRLPWGYHRLILNLQGRSEETLIISAPPAAYAPEAERRSWGLFVPLYALHNDNSWASGSITDLNTLMAWSAERGAGVIATLPLLAHFPDDKPVPSPYRPISRLMWGESYLDMGSVPEMQDCPIARELMASSSFQSQVGALRKASFVDYHQQMRLKRRVLEEMCRCLFASSSDRLGALLGFAGENQSVQDYARFRAAHEKLGTPWQSWPQLAREGTLQGDDFAEPARRYHLYVQWLAEQQIRSLADDAVRKNVQLYFDLPLGVHPNGYDVWCQRRLFVRDFSAGAPPDTVFTKGQVWGSPPLHPDKIREQGYRYTIAYLRHNLRYAGILRIDHVMGLHRLFCIPNGMEASQGAYIRYRSEELYAILTLESHRNRAIIVGEDLGTVPVYVRAEMARHKLYRMYVVQYELASDEVTRLPPIPKNTVASLNTHDMYPFTAFWQGLDIEERLALGLLDKKGAQLERQARQSTRLAIIKLLRNRGLLPGQAADVNAILRACLSLLGGSRARIVLLNMEDLWLETRPQNVPGTGEGCPNWGRKMRYSFEALSQLVEVNEILREIDIIRAKRGVYSHHISD
jgi:4-alpha-glucanotransferase